MCNNCVIKNNQIVITVVTEDNQAVSVSLPQEYSLPTTSLSEIEGLEGVLKVELC